MSYPSTIIFDYALFQEQVPEFGSLTESTVQAFWETGVNYVSDTNYGALRNASRVLALNYMAAHIAYCSDIIAGGDKFKSVKAATIDKESVTLEPPPQKNLFQWWLSLSPRGDELRAMLSAKSVGGMYLGGSPASLAYPKPRL